jgi:hypothetical protein
VTQLRLDVASWMKFEVEKIYWPINNMHSSFSRCHIHIDVCVEMLDDKQRPTASK